MICIYREVNPGGCFWDSSPFQEDANKHHGVRIRVCPSRDGILLPEFRGWVAL